ncbi:fimbrillin family protein [Parabacteroides faecis]|uniref:fimbrillin family protein n=2 Tax=Parabacteroides faecis TaxID=1217282 RepID=UPI00216486E7|nr:fimbrillin family protein [Parabacteroides faecis]UVQ46694.1 fimbrillin family protein [Parabacteroides faecis]
MKTNQVMAVFAATTLLLAACSNEENFGNNEKPWDGRLHFSSKVAELTRTGTYNLDTKIANGEKVWLYIDKATGPTQIYGKELTANGSTGFTGGDDMSYPAGEASISLYAFHGNITYNDGGNKTAMPDNYPTVEFTHAVTADQKTEANYAKSDLLYAKETKTQQAVKDASGAVALTFKHLLSKIEVVLKKGTGMDAVNITKVEILNTKLKGTFTPAKATGADAVAVAAADNTAAPIEINADLTTGGDVLNEAIIIPQTVANEAQFIKVTLSTGGELFYKLKKETTFAKGTKYKYTITANLTDLTVTSEVTGWGTGTGDDSGSAIM